MGENLVIIPLYLNKSMINNLFTIVINKFSQTQTLNTRKQVILKADTPLANVIPDKCIQGNFSFQYLDECGRQDTERRVSIIIETLFNLRDILWENKLLKKINRKEELLKVEVNDFVEISCEINHNPHIEQIKNIARFLELDLTFRKDFEDNKTAEYESKKEILRMIKDSINEYEDSKCLKYLSSTLIDTEYKAMIPIFKGFMEDNLDYMHDSKVTILGKVVRKTTSYESEKINLLSGTCFDYFDEQYFKDFMSKYFSSMNENFLFMDAKRDLRCPLIEIIPIAIYV